MLDIRNVEKSRHIRLKNKKTEKAGVGIKVAIIKRGKLEKRKSAFRGWIEEEFFGVGRIWRNKGIVYDYRYFES